MERNRAARLLGISPTAEGDEAHRAYLAKLSELDGRIATAPSETLRAKYEWLRGELKEAFEEMGAGYEPGDAAEPEVSEPSSLTPETPAEGADEPVASPEPATEAPEEVPAPTAEGSRARLWVGLAGLVVLLVGVLAETGVLGGLWETVQLPSTEDQRSRIQEAARLKEQIEEMQGRLQDLQVAVESEERRLRFQQASRLKVEVETLQQRLQATRQEAEREKADAQREVQRLEGTLRSAQTDGERTSISLQLGQAKARLSVAQKLLKLQTRYVFGEDDQLGELQNDSIESAKLIDPSVGQNRAAVERLQLIRSSYADLLGRLDRLATRAEAWRESEAALRDWASGSEGKSSPAKGERVSELRQRHKQADALTSDDEAIDQYRDIANRVNELRMSANAGRPAEAVGESNMIRQADGARWAELASRAVPEMVDIPGGRFRMGCDQGEEACPTNEMPSREVTVRAFKLGRYEVTFAQFDAFAEATGRKKPDDGGWGRDNRPLINVSWNDAQAFAQWLSKVTGNRFRLPTEAEWEYAARGGTTTNYPWGDAVGEGHANCSGCGSRWDGRQTAPVGNFIANPFGLYDMHGNVMEWVADCWNDSYADAPTDGRASRRGDCAQRVARGGSWWAHKDMMRSGRRHAFDSSVSSGMIGFRVAQDGS